MATQPSTASAKALPPLVHLNGTGGETLYNEYRKALQAVCDAQEQLCAATLHARDYYPYPDGLNRYYEAREQRTQQLVKLQEVQDYLAQFVTHLDPRLR